MAWRIEVSETAEKQLAKLDKPVAMRLRSFLRERLASLDDPRSIGQALRGSELGEFWKYRVGDCRLICQIKDGPGHEPASLDGDLPLPPVLLHRVVCRVSQLGFGRGMPRATDL